MPEHLVVGPGMVLEVLQLTDLHLMAVPESTLKGICTRQSFADTLKFVDAGVQSGRWKIDHVVVTGDMAHDEQLDTYQALRDMLGRWLPQCRLLPGNHDDRKLIRQVFPDLVPEGEYVNFSFEAAGWRLIGLDSQVTGETAGEIDADQLAWLAGQLTQFSTEPTVLFMHHPPFAVQSAWLDRIGLRNRNEFMEFIKAFSQVHVISTGHVHQEFSGSVNGVQCLTTPSTAVQFRPHEDELVCDPIAPGFRVFRLEGNKCHTRVIRLWPLSSCLTAPGQCKLGGTGGTP